ncbi:MAG: hypothetical protein K1X71_02615 [Pirellulales bacterium]|nr:hypothetical protein [Pirellulales bacterium]
MQPFQIRLKDLLLACVWFSLSFLSLATSAATRNGPRLLLLSLSCLFAAIGVGTLLRNWSVAFWLMVLLWFAVFYLVLPRLD